MASKFSGLEQMSEVVLNYLSIKIVKEVDCMFKISAPKVVLSSKHQNLQDTVHVSTCSNFNKREECFRVICLKLSIAPQQFSNFNTGIDMCFSKYF